MKKNSQLARSFPKLKYWVWLSYVVLAVMTYVLAITLFGIGFMGPMGIGTHLLLIVIVSAIAFSPLWLNEALLQGTRMVRYRYLTFCCLLLSIILVGLVQSEVLFAFFRFSVPLEAVALHFVMNLVLALGFSVLVNKLIAQSVTKNAPIFRKKVEEDLELLLERKSIAINIDAVIGEYRNKTVLITGAAGSIGSELLKQLMLLQCERIIAFDQSEAGSYELRKLCKTGTAPLEIVIGDIRDLAGTENVFARYKPHIVFHAAAYKQVPLLEEHPYEAIRANVCGTRIVADLAVKYKAEKFILISTDKAVNPTTVLGATKRLAELYCNAHQKQKDTRFIITRFGNVFGSSGSVIPLFQEQIAAGGPLTVTHEQVRRFFMSVAEACHLVLEAGAMGKGGEIYLFDMGEQVKIMDLAKRMIQLAGMQYPDDIDIVITGLRPGEKLEEELFAKAEGLEATYHEKIKMARTEKLDYEQIVKKIDELCMMRTTDDFASIAEELKGALEEIGEATAP